MIRTRNFTLNEVIHRPDKLPDELLPIAYSALGTMQAIRDALCFRFGKEVPVEQTSGYRELAYNLSIGSSKNSFHIWRFENGKMIYACDFKPKGVPLRQALNVANEVVKGEVYLHRRHGFIHAAPCGPEQTWVQ